MLCHLAGLVGGQGHLGESMWHLAVHQHRCHERDQWTGGKLFIQTAFSLLSICLKHLLTPENTNIFENPPRFSALV